MAKELSELTRAALVYEKLVMVADGGETEKLDSFDASTILAMLDDAKYRARVIRKHQKLFHGR